MNPIVLAAAFGFLKGYFVARRSPEQPADGSRWLTHVVMGPLWEEAVYRAIPLYTTGTMLPRGWTAVPFALEHVLQESEVGMHQTTGSTLTRFADTFFGGVLYELAFRRFGLLGAVVAHSLHNVSTFAGAKTARRWR